MSDKKSFFNWPKKRTPEIRIAEGVNELLRSFESLETFMKRSTSISETLAYRFPEHDWRIHRFVDSAGNVVSSPDKFECKRCKSMIEFHPVGSGTVWTLTKSNPEKFSKCLKEEGGPTS